MTDIKLPPLPYGEMYDARVGWSDDQMLDYATAAVLADREARSEPVAHLHQHAETGRTRVVMPDQIATTPAGWLVVGPLYLAPQPVEQRKPLTDEQIDKLLFDAGATGTSVHLDELVCGYVVKPMVFDAIIRAVERMHDIGKEAT